MNAGVNKTRANERTVEFSDTFSGLVTKTNCYDPPVPKPRKHWIYPITGKIGLDEVIKTFIVLSKKTGSLSTFSDKLTFTTVFGGAVNPTVTLNPGPLKKFRLASATATYGSSRSDQHEVTLTLSEPPAPTIGKSVTLGDGVILKYEVPDITAAVGREVTGVRRGYVQMRRGRSLLAISKGQDKLLKQQSILNARRARQERIQTNVLNIPGVR